MRTTHRIVAFALFASLAVALWWSREPSTPLSTGSDSATASGPTNPVLAQAKELAPRTEVPESGVEPEPIELPPLPSMHAATLEIGGMVVGIDGRAVPDVALTWEGHPFDPPAKSDAEGRFHSRRPATMGNVDVDDPRYVALLRPVLFDGDQVHADLTVVVAPRAELRGVVVDTDGAPISAATISAGCGVDLRAAIPRVLDRDIDVSPETHSEVDGTFAMLDAPRGPGASIHISARGYESLRVATADAVNLHRFELHRRFDGDDLRGKVVDDKGEPVGHAQVNVHDLTVVTTADGGFVLSLWQVGELPDGFIPQLVVQSSNRLPVAIAALDRAWRTRRAWPADLTIQIGGAGASITGRVIRADGTPVEQPSVSFEPPVPRGVAGTLSDTPSEWDFSVIEGSDSPGFFTTGAVEPGRYRLRVMDPNSLQIFVTDPIATGSHEVVIRLPAIDSWPALHGVVVDRYGAPVAGADWILERSDPSAEQGGPVNGAWHNATADGVIEHPPLSREVSTLCVKAAGMAEWRRLPIADLLPRPDGFRIVVPVGRQARIELDGEWRDVALARLVDASGAASPVVLTRGNIAWGARDITLDHGRSTTFVALDDCIEMQLYRDGEVVRRVPIRLEPSVVNVLRP